MQKISEFIKDLLEDGADTNTVVDYLTELQQRIDTLEYAVGVMLMIEEESVYMTAKERDAIALEALGCNDDES